jgi:Immunity protein 8
VRPVVKHFLSPDVGLGNFSPEDPTDFSFLLQALVGPAGQEGEESLQFIVCTPRHLAKQLVSDKYSLGRGLVLIGSSDIQGILRFVQRAVERVEGSNWADVGRAFVKNRLVRVRRLLVARGRNGEREQTKHGVRIGTPH